MERIRNEVEGVLVLSAGNLLFKREAIAPKKQPPAALKADLIIDSFNVMGCDALNVGAYDLSLGIDYLLEKQSASRFPFLSANLADQHGTLYFPSHVILDVHDVKVGVFGLISPRLKRDKVPAGHKLTVQDPRSVATEMVKQLQEEGAEFIVLLTDMLGRPLRKVGLWGLPIDLVIGSDKRNQISLPIAVKNTFIAHLDRGGKSVGRLDVTPLNPGGPGDGATAARGRGKVVGGNLFLNHFVQLRLEIPDHPEIGPKVAAFEKREAALQKELLVANGDNGGDCGTAYIGAEACRSCHAGRYQAWQTTDHSRALATLASRNKQYDEECLVCHALAYECQEGQMEIADVERFANVQCESCHGPGDLHAASEGGQQTRPLTRPEAICVRCHTPERSDDMDFTALAHKVCSE